MPEPRVEVDRYVVYPTGYDDLVHTDEFVVPVRHERPCMGMEGHARARHRVRDGDESAG